MRAIWIRLTVLVAVCFGAFAPTSAQQAPRPPAVGTGMIAGRVVDANGDKPISTAIVSLSGGGPTGRGTGRVVSTDSQGRFVFVSLVAGTYLPQAQVPGYSQPVTVVMRAVELAEDQKLTDVTIRLHRLASIAGTVSDENGDAVPGIGVVAFRRAVVNGQMIPLPSSEARTDDRGIYRLTNLQTGDYFVCACRRDPIPVDGVLLTALAADPVQLIGLAARAVKVGADVASIDGLRTVAPAFHPASALMSRATRITLAEGDARTNIDIQVPVVRAGRISGQIIGAPGVVNASVIRMRPAGEMPEATPLIEPMLVQPDGRFDFAGVPPGAYMITVSMTSVPTTGGGPTGAALALIGGRSTATTAPPLDNKLPPPAIFWGQTSVAVGDTDVSGVTITLRPAPRVTAKLELPASHAPTAQGQPPPVRSLQFTPLPADSRGLQTFGVSQRDGSYEFAGVAPGRYGLFTLAAPGLRLDRVTIHGEDVTDLPMEIGETDVTDLVVTFVTGAYAKFSGTVAGTGPDSCVLFFPADRRFWVEPGAARRRFFTAPVSRTGTFATPAAMPAGDYLVILVPDEQSLDWQIQSRIEALAPRAQKIGIGAGETKVIEVKR